MSSIFKLDRNVSPPLDMFIFAPRFQRGICLETKDQIRLNFQGAFPMYVPAVLLQTNYKSRDIKYGWLDFVM